jgi:peptidoglycan hydrolase-like protein with peptidoglycan-binding domain
MNDIRSIINLIERKAYRIQSNGELVNFNVNRDLPSIQIRDRTGEIFDLHGKDTEKLKQTINNYPGWHVFNKAAPKDKNAKPTEFKATHFHKNNLGLTTSLMLHTDGKFYFQKRDQETNKKVIAKWRGNTNNRSALNPASVDGEIVDGEKVDYPEDTTFADTPASKVDTEEPAAQAGGNEKLESAKTKYTRFMELLTKAMADTKTESYMPRSYADQLLSEALEGDELEELQSLYAELKGMELDFDDEVVDQINDAINKYDMWKAGDKDANAGIDGPADGTADAAGDSFNGDYSSDEAIEQAVGDVDAWIANEMPKELESKNANGLNKATNRGKIKSASAAAIQTVLMRIGVANNNEELKKIKADGYFGPASISATKRAQTLADLKVDGDPGKNTAKALLDYSKDPQSSIDDSLEKDFARIQELIAKHKAPAAESMFDMRSMLETLQQLNEALSPEEMEELKGLLNKHKAKLEDPETAQAYAQYDDVFKAGKAIASSAEDPAAQSGASTAQQSGPKTIDEITNHVEVAQGLYNATKGGMDFGMGTNEEAVFTILAKLKDAASYTKVIAAYKSEYQRDLTADLRSEMSGGDLENLNVSLKRLGVEQPAAPIKPGETDASGKVAPRPEKNFLGGDIGQRRWDKQYSATHNPDGTPKSKVAPGGPAGGATAPEIQKTESRTTMKKTIKESASMNISMSADNASEVSELLNILKNAGMPNAAPVGAIDMPMDTPMPIKPIPGGAGIDLDRDGNDDMEVGPMDHGHDMPDESPCGGDDNAPRLAPPSKDIDDMDDIIKLSGGKSPMDDDVDEDGWDNSPDEEYKDDDTMYQSGGIHKPKKAYAKAQDGDNAMAVESVKERLWAALQEKATAEGKDRGKKKLKASRGNEDIKTTEGSKGKKSRGKKSRG